jgi:hypothetical protein
MTLTINLPPEEIMALQARALAQGVSAEQYVRRVIEDSLKAAPAPGSGSHPSESIPPGMPDRPPIWEVIADSMRDIPPEDLAALPKDGAAQIDHYVYGLPKRAE